MVVAALIGLALMAWSILREAPPVGLPVAIPILRPATPAPASAASASPIDHATTSAPASPSATPRTDPRTAGSPLAAELNAPGGRPERDVQVLHEILRQYLRLLHSRVGLPIGNDTDLLRALTGRNPMKLVFLPPTHPAVGADARLRDRWGTPYFIHPRGNAAFEIRSAGPDHRLFTDDDLVANPAPALAPPAESGESER